MRQANTRSRHTNINRCLAAELIKEFVCEIDIVAAVLNVRSRRDVVYD